MLNKILLTGLAALGLGTTGLQAQSTCGVNNLWVNPSLENTAVGNQCTQWNPLNAYWNTAAPFLGFTSFTYVAGATPIQPGVLNEPLTDHTTGAAGGHYYYMDPRNGSGATYQVRQTIKVKPGTSYTFSAWFTSMLTAGYASLPATVQLVVNGTPVSSTLTLTGTATNWVQLSGAWSSGANTTAVVDIVAINPSIGGHDFAIDDIFFGGGDLYVNAGKDAKVCPGKKYDLGGSPTADYGATCGNSYTYSWSPATAFTTPANIANPTIQPTVPGIYTYTVTVTDLNGQTCSDDVVIEVPKDCDATKCDAPTLWVNGTFENTAVGNHCDIYNPVNAFWNTAAPFYGYTTFTYDAGGTPVQPGVLNEPLADHTTGAAGGHYLYVDPRNGSGSTYQIRQDIKVRPNTNYNFSAWFTSMLTAGYSASPATVQLVVNGTPVTGTITLTGTATNWVQLSGTWFSGTATTATAEIVAISPSIGGHDFAIDDIEFGPGDITANAGPDAVICINQTYALGGAPTADYGATCGGQYTYSWTPVTGFLSPANVSNPAIQLPVPGVYTYTVKVTDLNGQSCEDEVTIVVDKNCEGNGKPQSAQSLEKAQVELYPNPVRDNLMVRNSGTAATSLTIYDNVGRKRLERKLNSGITEIELGSLTNGVYFYQVRNQADGRLLKSGALSKK
jgi:hypothetical protein